MRASARLRRLAWLMAAASLWVQAEAAVDAEQGRRIFTGDAPVAAHNRGATPALPAAAVGCINCHMPSRGAEPLGPRLTADYLLTLTPRRGGPPTAYDRNGFCQALSSSVDVGGVLLAKAMPQYQLTDADCTALWSFLLTQ
ncbi:hypothetical protein [Cupriavidus plantarum]|uniref:hypothetical protein n=1 Tax=Cupriavidus plantarum TaxID=942865 RepID=UPI00339D3261